MADERAGAEHATLGGDRARPETDPALSFRQDGRAAVDWAADYIERVRDLPVLARGRPTTSGRAGTLRFWPRWSPAPCAPSCRRARRSTASPSATSCATWTS